MRPPDTSVIAGRLLPLGYKKYAEYLESEHWLELRRALLKGPCECGAHATQLHHLTYDRLGAELPGDLEPLCERCHAGRHSRRPNRRRRAVRKRVKKQRRTQELAQVGKRHLRPLAFAVETPRPPKGTRWIKKGLTHAEPKPWDTHSIRAQEARKNPRRV